MVERQVGGVVDLNKCMGCQTCSIACKKLWTCDAGMEHMWWNKVNTMPGQGSPRGWENMGGGSGRLVRLRMKEGDLPSAAEFGEYVSLPFEEVYSSDERARLAPKARPEWMYNWDEDQGGGVWPNSYFFYLPRLCNQCAKPACVEACPRGAIYKRREDGIVLIDEEECRGYRHCMEACPYKVIYFNPKLRSAHRGGISQKCVGCFPRVEAGVAPACFRQCPGRARFYGWMDDKTGPVHKLVKKWKVALPLHPECSTGPNIFYVPPLSSPEIHDDGRTAGEDRIPAEYLESLFGPGIHRAIELLREERRKVMEGGESELMALLIGYQWPDDFFPGFGTPPHHLERSRGAGAGSERPADAAREEANPR